MSPLKNAILDACLRRVAIEPRLITYISRAPKTSLFFLPKGLAFQNELQAGAALCSYKKKKVYQSMLCNVT